MIIYRRKAFSKARSKEDLEKLSDLELGHIVKKASQNGKNTKKLAHGLGMIGAGATLMVGKGGGLGKSMDKAIAGYVGGASAGLGIGIATGRKKKKEAKEAIKILRERQAKK